MLSTALRIRRGCARSLQYGLRIRGLVLVLCSIDDCGRNGEDTALNMCARCTLLRIRIVPSAGTGALYSIPHLGSLGALCTRFGAWDIVLIDMSTLLFTLSASLSVCTGANGTQAWKHMTPLHDPSKLLPRKLLPLATLVPDIYLAVCFCPHMMSLLLQC